MVIQKRQVIRESEDNPIPTAPNPIGNKRKIGQGDGNENSLKTGLYFLMIRDLTLDDQLHANRAKGFAAGGHSGHRIHNRLDVII